MRPTRVHSVALKTILFAVRANVLTKALTTMALSLL